MVAFAGALLLAISIQAQPRTSSNTYFVACLDIISGKPENIDDAFVIQPGGSWIYLYLAKSGGFGDDYVSMKVYRQQAGDYTLFESKSYSVDPEWLYTYFKYTFTKAGEYKLVAYDANGSSIGTTYVTISMDGDEDDDDGRYDRNKERYSDNTNDERNDDRNTYRDPYRDRPGSDDDEPVNDDRPVYTEDTDDPSKIRDLLTTTTTTTTDSYQPNFFWKDFGKNPYNISFSIRKSDYSASVAERDSYKSKYGATYDKKSGSVYYDGDFSKVWYDLYFFLLSKNKERIKGISETLKKKATEKGLNYMETAEMVVTMVQNIEYYRPIETNFDIYTPLEFLVKEKGDCDTRTVFLYGVLTYIGYDVLIFWSGQYGHSMLGISCSGYGKYKMYNGKKYYFWETTAPDYELGQMPSDWDDPYYWDVAFPPYSNI